MKRFLLRLLLRLLSEHEPKSYQGIDETAREEWLVSIAGTRGFQSYFMLRDLQLLKSIASGVDRETYLRLIGQRGELLYLVGESKQMFDRYQKHVNNPKKDKKKN